MASANIRDSEVYGLLDLSDSEISDFIPDSEEDSEDEEDEPSQSQLDADQPPPRCVHI